MATAGRLLDIAVAKTDILMPEIVILTLHLLPIILEYARKFKGILTYLSRRQFCDTLTEFPTIVKVRDEGKGFKLPN